MVDVTARAMDFYRVEERETRKGIEIFPDFVIHHSGDLMIRGGAFYAVWNPDKGAWSQDEIDVQRIIDADLYARAREIRERNANVRVLPLNGYKSGAWTMFRTYCNRLPDMYMPLDSKLVFANDPVRKEDYSSKRLPYNLEHGSIAAYDRLMSVLFEPPERHKLEWAVGSIIAGDSSDIQKFIVLYGEAGTGKSTFLHIVEQLFQGYWTVFDAQALIRRGNSFVMESFKENPLVAISHDSDLSQIEDNTLLNTIVAHERMTINEKYRSLYQQKINAFLFIGSNMSVRITDAKSGLIRRLINVNSSGNTVPPSEYDVLMSQIQFELGAIAHHCLDVYRAAGKHYYANYRPTDMMIRTDIFYNFMVANFDMLKERNGITLKEAWRLYKDYCDEAGFERKMNMHRFRDELRNYFGLFYDRKRVGSEVLRSLFVGFKTQKLTPDLGPVPSSISVVMDDTTSLLDVLLKGQPAQYATDDGTPGKKWTNVTTTLADLDTSRTHYVKPPPDHIVIDFDLRGDSGEKSPERNLEAASKFPPTYAEYSQSGNGVHLHYVYTGDVSKLSRVYDDGIEIKVFSGDSSLRRKLTRCNNVPVAPISEGLPLKEKRLIDSDRVQTERGLRRLILRNLHKEIHPGTKPSIDFIHKILEDAYKDTYFQYDVSDMRPDVLAFANNSTNHAIYCIKKVQEMKFASEPKTVKLPEPEEQRLVFFDSEVFPNLFVVCWKFQGDSPVVKMINPGPAEIEEVSRLKLVGFNNRRFDNHIFYARMMGYDNEELFKLSQRLIKGERSAYFGDAYSLSYSDIWDFSSVKKGLKWFQVELGLNHRELGLPWDQPVDPALWEQVANYCANDVITEEQVFDNRKQDYVARQILAKLSGLSVNETTQKHTARILFGSEKHPQDKFVYTDLSGEFPGYKYEMGKSTYRGETVGEGGYVYAEPGMYSNVAVLDIASMHPTSIEMLNLFGPYTRAYSDLKAARIAIKHGDYDSARSMLGGALGPFLGSADDAKALSYALKIVLNIVYGLTSASFDNPFRDLRNKDNIVAKRGALFMIDLKKLVQEAGDQVIHIKTDSIKIPGAGQDVIDMVIEYGHKFGYDFEHEETYSKLCLVNDAVYIGKNRKEEWTAVGAQFAHPYVFKTLFSKEPVEFEDLCETKTVTTALYLQFDGEDPHFVGRAGSFIPVKPGTGGAILLREKDGTFHSATGAKGYFWREAATVKELGLEDDIDFSYFRKLADDAVNTISKHGDYEWFTS